MSSVFWDLELSLSKCVPTMMTGEWGARACGNVEGGGVRVWEWEGPVWECESVEVRV